MPHKTSSNPDVFILPDLGEGVHEAELIKWRVSAGDTVEEHDTLAEMETDKALVEVPSPRDGVIAILHGAAGDICKVGEPLVTYQAGEGSNTAAPEAASAPSRQVATASASSSDNGSAEREDAGTVVGSLSANPAVERQKGKALATPAVRRIARDMGVNINNVTGTGLAGRVTEKDVRAAASSSTSAPPASKPQTSAPHAQPSQAAPAAHVRSAVADEVSTAALAVKVAGGGLPAPAPTTGDLCIPFRGTRRTIANRLRHSMDTAVHFTVMDEANVSRLDAVRRQTAAASGEKLSYLPFIISALCRALKLHPSLNANVDDEAGEIIQRSAVHMGVATDTEHGLSVPVIPDADTLGVLEIGRHVTELARMTRDRSIPRERLMGSTFTISNVGSYAGRFASPVINYPEVAILAAGRVREGVVADAGAIRIGKLLPLSLACDHRVVDGAEAARCLATIIELLADPQQLLTPARG